MPAALPDGDAGPGAAPSAAQIAEAFKAEPGPAAAADVGRLHIGRLLGDEVLPARVPFDHLFAPPEGA